MTKTEIASLIELEMTIMIDGTNSAHYKIKVQSKNDEDAWKQFKNIFTFIVEKQKKGTLGK